MRQYFMTRLRLCTFLLAAAGMLGFGALTGCDDNNAVEEAAEEVADEIDDAM